MKNNQISQNNELKINNLRKLIAELYLQKAQISLDKINIDNTIKQGVKNRTININSVELNIRNSLYNDLRSIVTQIAIKENELSKLEQSTDLKYLFKNSKNKIKKTKSKK